MNMNVAERDEILFGGYDPEQYYGGIRHFNSDIATIKTLMSKDFIDPDDCQNYSPSAEEFVKIAETEGVDAAFGGYAVSPNRSDYRITITDITVEFDAGNTDLLIDMIGHLRYADEFNMSINNGKCQIYAWWD